MLRLMQWVGRGVSSALGKMHMHFSFQHRLLLAVFIPSSQPTVKMSRCTPSAWKTAHLRVTVLSLGVISPHWKDTLARL